MPLRRQIPKHETRNTWLAGLCNITKENFLSKKSMKNVAWELVPGPF